MELAGPRGKSAFAKRLGLSPSTYAYYESTRIPPADVLVRIADLSGADLRWLLTGETRPETVPSGHPVVARAAKLLSERPQAAAALAAFLDILASAAAFPSKEIADEAPAAPPVEPREAPAGAQLDWIPILGRSAAGVPQFWADDAEASGVTTLDALVRRRAGATVRRQATARLAETDDAIETQTVQLITLREPAGDTAEFLAAPELRARHADAFAVRIDGDSMSPEIRHGDVVVLSPSEGAVEGRAAVVQLHNQIGVTCKLYRREGGRVHLVPVNERYTPAAVAADSVVWALRVLARIRSA